MQTLLLLFCNLAGVLSSHGVDYKEFATTIQNTEIPIRQPSPFAFNKDRTPSSLNRIIGGDVVDPHSYPFQVALYISVYSAQYFCGGSLVTPQWVLSAAHCVDYATEIIVVLGVHNLTAEEESRMTLTTSTYFIHENWNVQTLQNDVALIRLPTVLMLNDYINVVPIASGSDTYTGDIGTCLGWGVTSLGSTSDVLKYVDDTIISNQVCSAYAEYSPYIVSHHLCTSGDGFVGSCSGDSGGALLVNGTQVGIVSFGVSNCSAGWPSVYTRVTEFYTWINNTISDYVESDNDNVNDVNEDESDVNDDTLIGKAYHNRPTIDLVLGTIVAVVIAISI